MKKITLLTCCLSLFGTMASAQVLYDDFESNSAAMFGTTTKFNYIATSQGLTTLNAANPDNTGINTSAKVGKWERPNVAYQATQFATFQTMSDMSVYATNTGTPPKIKMKINTDAPIGSEVLITIGSRTDMGYPSGAYTTFITTTTVKDEWEQLTFNWNPNGIYNPVLDANQDFGFASATDCGRFVIQIAGNATTAYVVYFDDIEGPELEAKATGANILYDDFQSNTGATAFATSSKFASIANSNGAIAVNQDNPSTTGNASTKVAQWDRPSGDQYPNTSFLLRAKLTDAYAYASNMSGTPKITMKVYTDAPIGTKVLVRLDSALASPTGYPNYVFTTFEKATTVTEAWETITLDWQPNGTNGGAFGGTSRYNVSRFTVVIDNGGTTGYSLYMDDIEGPGLEPITTGLSAAATIAASKIYPNPSSDMVTVQMELKASSDVKITLSDLMGKEVMTIAEGKMMGMEKSFSTANLKSGVYTVNYFVNGSAAKAELLMVK